MRDWEGCKSAPVRGEAGNDRLIPVMYESRLNASCTQRRSIASKEVAAAGIQLESTRALPPYHCAIHERLDSEPPTDFPAGVSPAARRIRSIRATKLGIAELALAVIAISRGAQRAD